MKISIIGSGSWGIALAKTAAENSEVKLLVRRQEIADQINKNKSYKELFPGVTLDFSATTSVEETQNFSDTVLIAIPMKYMKLYCLKLKSQGLNPKNIISAAKGFDIEELKTGTQIISEVWPEAKVAALSGPSHAESLVEKAYTSVMIASKDIEILNKINSIMKTKYFKMYKTDDLFGVELYGAAKNVYSIGAGILDTLGLLDNTKAAYITRVIAELERLGKTFGIKESTVYSLACLGDLLVTSYSDNSRNYKYGKYLVTKKEEDKPTQTVEGLNTVETLHTLMNQKGVRMPILCSIYKTVIKGECVKTTTAKLILGENNE